MKAAENFTKDRPGQEAIVCDVANRDDFEDRGGGNRAQHDEPANPEHEGEQAGIPQREHPLIIITMIVPDLDASARIAWQPWGAAPFARARAEHKVVLLSIGATWCHWCHEMDRTSYADAEVAALVHDRFIAVRVDADERPDISERYNLGGWPTTAFLTPDGEILTGGTFVPMERLRGVLARVSDEFANRTSPAEEAPRSTLGAHTAIPDVGSLIDAVFATFDSAHGGFGIEPKFPLAAPIQLALDLWQRTQDPRYEAIAISSLDAMGWRGLYDPIDGGFFRYATTRDWQLPHHEKLLETNAALIGLYLNAGTALHAPRLTDRAADTLRYIQNTLADPVDGGWRASQQADPHYYAAASADERRALASPPMPDQLYADATAAMASAALHASRVFGDEGLRAFAVKSLERVLLACYKPGGGVAHYSDGQPHVRGLLADQIAMAAACLDAFDTTQNVVYEMMAEELAHFAVRAMWDEEDGAFFDRSREDSDDEIGLLRQGLKPFVTNCDAARLLRRLAATSGDNDFVTYSDRTLAAIAPFAVEQGPLAAHYLLARPA